MSDSDISSFDESYDGMESTSSSSDDDNDSADSSEMMVIEIAFGKDNEDNIVVHWNDDPLELAQVLLPIVCLF